MPTRSQALSHYRTQQHIVLRAVSAVRTLFKRRPDVQPIARTLSAYQVASASASARTIAGFAGSDVPLTRPAAFGGYTAAGFPLTDPLQVILDRINADVENATQRVLDDLDRMVASEVADAGRAASQVEFVARPDWTNYVRMLNPPSCSRCAILAGRIYRDLEAFQRHPLCDCIQVPVTDWQDAHDNGLVSSARDLFDKGQLRGLSQADAKAIEDGADIAQVVNAQSGMATADLFNQGTFKVTTTGTTKRAAWRKAHPNIPYRLRPDAIYELAKGDRNEAVRLLRLYGYLL